MRKPPWSVVSLALLGLVLALVLGAIAHAITRDTVALPSTRLEPAEKSLAPAQAARTPTTSRRDDRRSGRTRTTDEETTATETDVEDDDRDRNRRRRGSDDSRSSSDNSGKGSDSSNSGSSGSGSSGSGGGDD